MASKSKNRECSETGVANHDPLCMANDTMIQGNTYLSSGKYETAIVYFKKSLEIYTNFGEQSAIANANCLLGSAYFPIGKYKEAISSFEEGLKISTAIGDQSGIANNNGNLGNAYLSLGEYQKAIQYYEKGLELSAAIGDQSGIANNNCNLGNVYLRLGEYQKAIQYSEKGIELSTAIGDQSGIANNNCNLGNVYLSLGEYQKAIQYYETGLELSTAIGDRSRIENSNYNLGNAYLKLGEYQKAIQYCEKALKLSTAIGDQSGIASNNGNLGHAYLSLGEYQKAIQYYEKSLKLSTAIGDQSGIARNNGNLGDAYHRLGEYQKAIQYSETGLELSTAIGNQSGIASNNWNLGNAYRNLGEYQKAIQYYEKSLKLSTAIGDQLGIASNNGNLGDAYFSLGEYQKAIQYYETGLELTTAIGNQSGIEISNSNLGNVYLSLGEYQKAIQYYEKSLKLSTAIGNRSGIASNNRCWGNACLSLGEYQKAIEHYEKSLELSTAIGHQSEIASDNGNLGNAYSRLGQYQKAIQYYEKGLELSTAIGNRLLIATSNINLGSAYLRSGEHKGAWSRLDEAIRLFDKMFFSFVPDRNKLSFTPQYFLAHLLLMSCFLSLERVKSALLAIDLGKAKELHFCIKKNRNRADTEVQDFALTTWNRISACEEEMEIREIQQVLQMAKNDASILVFAFDHEGLLNIWVLNEGFFFKKVDADGSDDIRSLIKELLGMFGVIVGRNSSFQENASIENTYNQVNYPLAISGRKPQPKNAVRKSSKCLSGAQEILKKLFQLVFGPVKDFVKGNKLIVIPDKQLFFAPFSSFIDENVRFLSSKYSIQITPSLHTLKASMQREHDPNIGFALFVGNPTVEKISFNGEEFGPLPGAANEVKYLAYLFQATPLLGRVARKQVVLELLSKASIIHIAAHGESKRGQIILAPNTSDDQSPASFLLRQEDITSISVQARLVVLSCCFTGQGEVSSEGVVGIARSFLAAGARSVLATLWPINDATTTELMKKFYDELCKETPVCEALRRAKNFFHEEPIRVWAPFTMYMEDVKFQKHEIEEIKKKSREYFTDFVVPHERYP